MRYTMRIAEIYLRQEKYKDASVIAEKIAKTADDDELRSRAEELANRIRQQQEMFAKYEGLRKRSDGSTPPASGPGVGEPLLVETSSGEDKPTNDELAKAYEGFQMRGLNQSLRTLEPGEVRLVGRVLKIDCKGTVTYSIKTDTDAFQLSSKDFQTLTITTFITDAG
jgi:hypothetical protein